MNVSQPVFARLLNVSDNAVRSWEQGAREPEGATLRLLEIAECNPDLIMKQVSK
jgi:putative transcriptional regulator